MAMLDNKVNLRGMLRLDPVEDLLSNVLQRLNEQDMVISELKQRMSGCMGREAAQDSLSELHRMIKNAQNKIDMMEADSVVQIGGRTASVRDVTEESYQQVKHLQELLTKYATKEILDETIADIHMHYDSEIQELKDNTATYTLVRSIQEGQNLTNEKLASLESLVSCKVDKNDYASLESLRLRLQTFADFKDNTTSALETLKERSNTANNALASHSIKIDALQALTNEHTETLKITTRNTVTATLQKEMEDVKADIASNYTPNVVFSELDNRVKSLRVQEEQTQQRATDLEKDVKIIEETLPTKASVTQVKACVLRTHFEDIISAMGNDIDLKAANDDLIRIETTQHSIEKMMSAERHRTDVAMRFIDWFTQRGEGYEHNMRLIDKHLGKLTSNANPTNRNPYTGQIKMAPLVGQTDAGAFPKPPSGLGPSMTTQDLYSEEKTKSLLSELDTMLKMGF